MTFCASSVPSSPWALNCAAMPVCDGMTTSCTAPASTGADSRTIMRSARNSADSWLTASAVMFPQSHFHAGCRLRLRAISAQASPWRNLKTERNSNTILGKHYSRSFAAVTAITLLRGQLQRLRVHRSHVQQRRVRRQSANSTRSAGCCRKTVLVATRFPPKSHGSHSESQLSGWTADARTAQADLPTVRGPSAHASDTRPG